MADWWICLCLVSCYDFSYSLNKELLSCAHPWVRNNGLISYHFKLMQVYREFHRSVHKRIVLECVWKGDKYFLLERTENKEDETREEDIQATPSSTTTIHYRTLELFDEGIFFALLYRLLV